MNDWPQNIAITILVISAWIGGLSLLGVFTVADIRAWKRLSALRGFASRRSALERVAAHVPLLQRVQTELDLQRMIAMASRGDSTLTFFTRLLALALLAFAAVLTANAAGRAVSGDWPLPPWWAVVIGAAVLPVGVMDLRRAARRRQRDAGQALGDMLMMLAVMTDSRGFQLDDAVRVLSRCASESALRDLVEGGGWRRLIHEPQRTTVDLYRLIGERFQVPLFGQIADAAATTNVGFPERDAYTRLALSFYHDRLSSARLRAARAKTLVTLPVAGLLIPLLLLIGAPTFQVVTQGLQGG